MTGELSEEGTRFLGKNGILRTRRNGDENAVIIAKKIDMALLIRGFFDGCQRIVQRLGSRKMHGIVVAGSFLQAGHSRSIGDHDMMHRRTVFTCTRVSISPFSILGIDLGGTKTALTLFDADTMVPRASDVFPTGASDGFAAVQDRLLTAVNALRGPDTKSIGLGVPGFIDPKTQHVISLPNIPESAGTDVRHWLADATGLPVVIENDARCFAYAEALFGAGKDHRVVLGVTLGTGVGGGIVIDRALYHGARGYAGEVGHALLMPGQPPYPTENRRGEVEQFLSGTAMGKRCDAAKRPEDYLEGDVCSFLRPEVMREVAWFIVNAIHFVDPSIVIFGGSTGRALEPHFAAIEKELRVWLLPGVEPPVLACGVFADAAVRGAALLAGAEHAISNV